MSYIKGQRYFNAADLTLGLGTVLAREHRMVQLHFGAVNETRIYAIDNAPLSRYQPQISDTVPLKNGDRFQITGSEELAGLIRYTGHNESGDDYQFSEVEIADNISLSRPKDRLLNAQIDSPKWFQLRQQAAAHQQRLIQSELYGLIGCRTALLAHQLYIAYSVSRRYAPRVLLADEVGLGKTIEAGLIVHAQLLNGQAQRVLFVVPDSLVHQWMVELMRRFNINVSVYDEEQCRALSEGGYSNPFEAAQQILIPLSLLRKSKQRFQQVQSAGWDLLVVDEAHHLVWPEEQQKTDLDQTQPEAELSPNEQAYILIERLSKIIPGVLLLTATPEQLGQKSHFARLRLLDSDRFSNYQDFIAEQQSFEPIAEGMELLINALEDDKPPPVNEVKDLLASAVDTSVLAAIARLEKHPEEAQAVVNRLLDQYGTGRVMFRNSRRSVSGFPERVLHHYPLTMPEAYATKQPQEDTELAKYLVPELSYTPTDETISWTELDPRLDWLMQIISDLKDEKIVLIVQKASTVRALAEFLRVKHGLHAALFHEGLSLVERDQAAAWFADFEQGTNLLLCSEIGSEGRNFQFAKHLILFDLPGHPDLLEQRIGRLDRIGQGAQIDIHVPVFRDSIQYQWYLWYQQGLDIFKQPNPAASMLFNDFSERLQQPLSAAELATLITDTQQQSSQLLADMSRGRDRLLEYHSHRPEQSVKLLSQAYEEEHVSELITFMHQVFELYGVDYEINSNGSEVLRPTEQMQGYFPRLSDEDMTVTYHRAHALANETCTPW